MITQKRTLLIIEDDAELNKRYKLLCKIALRELSTENLAIEAIDEAVKQAYTYPEAKAILQTYPIDFISVDLVLSMAEKRRDERERKEQGEPGGMLLLKELQESEKRPISVIVSGETLQSYAIDAYRKYGVLAFYQKDTLKAEEYKAAIKVAMLYLETAQLIASPQTELDLETAEEKWQRTLAIADSAGIEAQPLLEALGDKIKSTRSEQTHPVTNLPNGRWTEEQLKKNILRQEDAALIRVMLKGFGQFVAVYGSQEESILVFMADLLKEVRDKSQDQDLFIGHFGYREYASEPSFLIIPGEKRGHRLAEMARWIETEFERKGGAEIFTAREKGQKVTFAVEASVLTGKNGNFLYLEQLLDTLSLPHLPEDME